MLTPEQAQQAGIDIPQLNEYLQRALSVHALAMHDKGDTAEFANALKAKRDLERLWT